MQNNKDNEILYVPADTLEQEQLAINMKDFNRRIAKAMNIPAKFFEPTPLKDRPNPYKKEEDKCQN